MTVPTWATRAMTSSAGGATIASDAGAGAAYAREGFAASGNVVVSAILNGLQVFLGLIQVPTIPADGAYSVLTHSLYQFSGALYVFESGANITNVACSSSDAISITVNAGTVTYQKNGVTFYTSGVAASGEQFAAVVPNSASAGAGFTSLALTGLPVTTYAVTLSGSTVSPAGTVTATMTPVDRVAVTIDGHTLSGTPTTIVTGNTVTKAITLSADTVAPGGTVTATMTPQSGVTVTIDGDTINGTPTTVVTGVTGSTPTPPTIGPYPRWVSGELRFYKPTAGTNSLTGGTYKVLSASQVSGPYTVDVSANWADLSWRATDGTGEYVTADDLGLTVGSTTWYRDRITDSGNLVAEGQTSVYGGDDDSALCVLSFSGLTAGTQVSCKLSAPCEVNGTVYPTYQTSYTATVDGSGNATLTLPRCDAGENQDGSGTVFGIFTGASPSAFILYRRIPDSATATFASLVPPGEGYESDDETAGVLRSGEGDPDDGLGDVGDYYLDTLTGDLYQLRD